VVADSPAQQAGIQPGDVITSIGAYPVHNPQDFYNIEGQLPIGEEKRLEYMRGAAARQTNIKCAALRELDGGKIDPRFKGAQFEELPTRLNMDRVKGILLAELDENSVLARIGLRPGDIVTGANRQNLQNLKEFQDLVHATGGPILLQIRRDGNDYIARVD